MMFNISTPQRERASDPDRSSVYVGLLALLMALLTLPHPSAAQTTQTLSLDQGWNLVSLHVQPDDPSFASIFDGTDGAISSVKNEDGEAYLPSLGIEQISTWRADEGYKVHAETATTLDVTGTALAPGAVAIALEEGGNIVPYLPDRALAVEKAVMSIDESLVAVEDEDGRQYPSGSTPLDSLRPGQGYKVYVDRADTLRYPVVVETLDDALALTSVPVGSYVRVQGYHEPGDKGGGLFQVRNTACRTDGGTCFVFNEDLSSQQEIRTSNRLFTETDLPDSDLSWRTFELEYGPDADHFWPAVELHGHKTSTRYLNGFVNTKQGTVSGEGADLGGNQRGVTGDDTYDFRIRYKYATSTRRLVRTGVTDAVNVAWWGAKPVSNGFNGLEDEYTSEINWAVNRARRLLQEDPNMSTAYVDFPDTYYKLYGTMMPDNVILRGTGTKKTYENATVQGGVKMPPGWALAGLKDDLPKEFLDHVGRGKFAFTHGNFPEDEIGFQNFEIDGNRANNPEPFTQPDKYGGAGNVSNKLQNGGRWAGFSSPRSGVTSNTYPDPKHEYIEGLTFTLDNVSVRGVGGNHLNNSKSSIFLNATNVHTDRSQRNHHIYGFSGTVDGYVIEGQSWASTTKLGSNKDRNADPGNSNAGHRRNGESGQWSSTYKNVTAKNLKPNNFGWGTVLGLTGHTDMENVTVDFRSQEDLGGGNAFRSSVFGSKITDLTIYTGDGGRSLYTKAFYGPRTLQQYEITEFTDVTVHAEAGFTVFSDNQGRITNLLFKNFTVLDERGSRGGAPFPGDIQVPPNLRPPGATRLEYINFTWEPGANGIAKILPNPNNRNIFPMDTFVDQSTINNTGDWSLIIRNADESGKIGRGDRVYLSNTTFNIPLSSTDYEDQFHYALSPNPTSAQDTPGGKLIVEGGPTLRLRNCDTPNGRVSDSVGNTFTSSASDEGNDFVLIPTSLLGRPFEINTTLTSSPSGISSITGVDVANSDGTLRADSNPLEHDPYLKVNLDGTIGSGETVTIDWDARVTPLDQYSTTGLFITRPVIDRTSGDDPNASEYGDEDPLVSGNGPWTIDLRGVAASQETWEPPEYTASSGNTGVVTASMISNKHRDKQRDYILELTEQGTGTATITVTSNIQNVGTATTTFEVTVE